MTTNVWRPLAREARRRFEPMYLEYLAQRNGVPDFVAHTATRREEYIESTEGRRLRSDSGELLVDAALFERLQLGDAARAEVDPATLWTICTANVNFTESFGVEYGFEKLDLRPGEPLSWIMIEERYHTRLLVDCAEALGVRVREKPPRRVTALLVKALSRFPHAITDPLILCTELVAVVVLRALWARGREIFADHAHVVAYIDGAYRQIMVDEVGHVRNLRAKFGWLRLGLSRVLTLPIALIYLRDLPEVVRLIGARRLVGDVWRAVVTGRVEIANDRPHPLDLLEAGDRADPDVLEAMSIQAKRAEGGARPHVDAPHPAATRPQAVGSRATGAAPAAALRGYRAR